MTCKCWEQGERFRSSLGGSEVRFSIGASLLCHHSRSYQTPAPSTQIQTSKDRTNWLSVGTIPNNYASTIVTVKLTKSTGRFIRFHHNSYVGLGYLNIKKLNEL